MICCKIYADYSSKQGNFNKLMEKLSDLGIFIFSNNILFFADTEGNTTETKLKNLYKKNGFTKFYADVFDKTHPSNESDPFIQEWIKDKVFLIYVKEFEEAEQENMKKIKIGLDALSREVNKIKEKLVVVDKDEQSLKEGNNSG